MNFEEWFMKKQDEYENSHYLKYLELFLDDFLECWKDSQNEIKKPIQRVLELDNKIADISIETMKPAIDFRTKLKAIEEMKILMEERVKLLKDIVEGD
jgi:hypothetical protein